MAKISQFRKSDQEKVVELISSIMSSEFSSDASAYPVADIESLPKSYAGEGEAFFVARNGEEVIGTVGIKKEDDRTALMRRLFVATEHRKKSIGRELIKSALNFCDEMGYEEVIFKATSRMHDAIKSCEKNGFSKRATLQLADVELVKLSLLLSEGRKKMN